MLPDLSGVPVHDHAACMEMLDDDEELFSELVELFSENTAQTLENLSAAVSDGDAAGVAGCAHSIKGSSANLSVERVRALSSELEQLAIASQTDGFQAYCSALNSEFQSFLDLMVKTQ